MVPSDDVVLHCNEINHFPKRSGSWWSFSAICFDSYLDLFAAD